MSPSRSTHVVVAPGSTRRTVLVSSPATVDPSGLALRFGGHVEAVDDDMVAVVWRASSSAEPAMHLAFALHGEDGPGEALRVGIATVSSSDARGEHRLGALHLARILCELAPRGSTLVCGPSQAMPPSLRSSFYGTLYPSPSMEPVTVSCVLEVAAPTSRRPALVVGREAEVAELRRAIAKTVGSGQGVIVHVRGEAGIGKTQLLGEVRRIVTEHGFGVVQTLHYEHRVGRSRSAAAVLVRGLLLGPGARPEGLTASIERARANGSIEDEQLAFVRDLLGLPAGPEERRLFDAMEPAARRAGHAEVMGRLVRAAIERGPLLIEVEDVHWAGVDGLRMVEQLAALVSEIPLVLVMTSRLEGDPVDADWKARAGDPPMLGWELGRLGPADAQTMAAAMLSRRRAPWMLSSQRYVDTEAVLHCVERSGGHPLLLEQLLLGWQAGIDPSSPAPITELVMARLATLSSRDRWAVELAATYGTHFDVDAIAATMGGPWDVGVAVTAGVVAVQGREHRFTHALVRDAIYDGLTEERRRRLHRALARALEGPLDDPGLRAEHLGRAGDPEAPLAWLEAARGEHAAGRSGLALSYAERGLATARQDEVTYALLGLIGRIHVDQGRPEPALAIFERALSLARSPHERCRALLGRVSALRLQSRHEDAEAPLAEADALAATLEEDELIALAAYYRGCLLFARGDVDRCMAQHERAVRYARAADQPRTEALALSGLGDAYYARSRISSALEVIGRCVRLAQAHGLGRIEVGNLYMVGALRALENELEAGLRDCVSAARMAERVGNRRAEMLAKLNVGICSTVMGSTGEALGWIGQAMWIAEQMDARVFQGISWAFDARARLIGGDREASLERATAALSMARQGGMRFFGGVALGVLARATDSAREREQALDEGERLLAEPCLSHNYFYFYDDAIEAWSSMARWDRVERCADALDTVDAEQPIGRCRLLAARARALAGLGRVPGDPRVHRAARAVLADIDRIGFLPLRPTLERALAQAERAHGGGGGGA